MAEIIELPGSSGGMSQEQMQQYQMQMQMEIQKILKSTDPASLPRIKCEAKECDGEVFEEKIAFRKLSALMNPLGKEIRIPEPVIVCNKCGTIQDTTNLI